MGYFETVFQGFQSFSHFPFCICIRRCFHRKKVVNIIISPPSLFNIRHLDRTIHTIQLTVSPSLHRSSYNRRTSWRFGSLLFCLCVPPPHSSTFLDEGRVGRLTRWSRDRMIDDVDDLLINKREEMEG
jgi:hypothetical protein